MLNSFFIQVVIGMDVAASEFYGKDKTYDLNFKEEVKAVTFEFDSHPGHIYVWSNYCLNYIH